MGESRDVLACLQTGFKTLVNDSLFFKRCLIKTLTQRSDITNFPQTHSRYDKCAAFVWIKPIIAKTKTS